MVGIGWWDCCANWCSGGLPGHAARNLSLRKTPDRTILASQRPRIRGILVSLTVLWVAEIQMAEPTWNGFLRLSLVSCRIYLSPATSERKWVRLEPLNPKTGNPVVPGFVDVRTGEIVPADAAGQAHQFENGRYVSLDEGELRRLAGPPSQVIDIVNFIPKDSIDRLYFESYFYIYPDEPLGADTLFTLRTAMLRKGQAGLGHMHIGGRQRRVLVEPRDTGLMLTVLRSADQLEDVEFEARADTDVPVDLIEVAESLIARRSTSADPARFDDAYQEGLRVLVADKVQEARAGVSLLPQAGA
jgi:DNA end-binding protein Ku